MFQKMSTIDAILYINLEHRTDRNVHIRNELRKLCPDESRINRIDAIKVNPGALGCSKSHIKALEFALTHPEWNTILVVEDDFTFKSDNPDEIQATVNTFLQNVDKSMDMGLLSHHHTLIKYTDTEYPNIKQFTKSYTTSSYIVKKHYISKLLANFYESMTNMSINGVTSENCLDVHWNKLMEVDKWYGVFPSIGYQCDGYSDIQNGPVSYRC